MHAGSPATALPTGNTSLPRGTPGVLPAYLHKLPLLSAAARLLTDATIRLVDIHTICMAARMLQIC